MRISEILENENRDGETTKCFSTQNSTIIRFREVNQFSFNDDFEENVYLHCCEILNNDTDENIIITNNDVDDINDFNYILQLIYKLDLSFTEDFSYQIKTVNYQIVKMKGFRIIIAQSSDDFIMILFKRKFLYNFLKQLLGYYKQ
jgi:hypothetical protein